ncbi:MAG: hypothetical protein HQL32_09725 [Planctomycetes bacterium]|nr:hypothetical protein [Planctomycetota bacterium]
MPLKLSVLLALRSSLAFFLLICPIWSLSQSKTIFIYKPNSRYTYKRIDHPVEPVQILNNEIIETLNKKIDTKFLLSTLTDRIEEHYIKEGIANNELLQWLKEHDLIRRNLWLAIDPHLDEAPKVLEIFNEIRLARPKYFEKYAHLAIAFSLVYDTPDAITSSRYRLIWCVDEKQYLPLPTMLEVYDYFTNPKNSKWFKCKIDKLVWPLLIHLVDLDLNEDERTWAYNKFRSHPKPLWESYKLIKYDYDKLLRRPKLGSRAYSLENLFNPNFGGVCVDQTHGSSRVMKTFGIPSIKVNGHGRFGGIGHAWCGFLRQKGSRYFFDFTGRYNQNYYWTGKVFNPHTRENTSDRSMAMMLDGALVSYYKYIVATSLSRIAASIEEKHPLAAQKLYWQAIDENAYAPEGWKGLAWQMKKKQVEKDDVSKFFREMFKEHSDHPDLSLELMKECCVPDIVASSHTREKHFRSAARMYKDRPDLEVDLRIFQCQSLFKEGDIKNAVNLSSKTFAKHTNQGTLVIPLAKMMVEGTADKSAKVRSQCHDILHKITEKQFPKEYNGEASVAYVQMRELIDSIVLE